MRRHVAAGALLTLVLSGCTQDVGLPAAPPPASGTVSGALASTESFGAVADAYVSSGSPDANRGTTSLLLIDAGSRAYEAYLRFAVAGVAGPVSKATLRLYAKNGSKDGPAVFATGSAWTETGITWKNKPAASGTALDDEGAVVSGGFVELDVSALVRGDGTYDFVVKPMSTDGLDLYAREGATPPALLLEMAEPTVDTTAPSVAIGSPAAGATFTSEQTVRVEASATDAVGVTKVELFVDGALIGTDVAAPFTADWQVGSALNGAHSLSARAYDEAGNIGSSAAIPVQVDIAPATTAGATYYVDAAAGSDSNSGTSAASAWRTLAKASSATFAAGDQLLLNRGQAFTGPLTIAESGSVEARIRIASYGSGALPRVTGASSCVVVEGSRILVEELHADDCSWAGFSIAGSFVELSNSEATRNAAGLYLKSTAANCAVLNNRFVDNNKMSVLTEGGNDDSGAFGIVLHGDANEIAFNTITGSHAFSYDYGTDGAAIEVYGGRFNQVHHNVAIDNKDFTELGNSRAEGNVFAYNIVRSSLADAVFMTTRGAASSYGPVLRTQAYNNTVHLTGAESQGFVCHAGCSADVLRMRNNVIQAVWKVGYADAPFDEDHGLYFGGQRQFTMGPSTIVADPLFVDAAAGALRLQPSSRGIDSGTDVGYDADLDGAPVPQDGNGDGLSLPDRGAYEAGTGVAGEPPPVSPSGGRFGAEADAHVTGEQPAASFGSAATLLMDSGSENHHAYLRFSITGVSGTVSRATLRLFVQNGTTNGPAVHVTSTSWTEAGLTWSTKPAPIGAALADLGAVASGAFVEVDVTAAIAGDGAYAFVLVPGSSDGFDVSAREGTSPPELVVDVSAPATADTTAPAVSIASPSTGTTFTTAQIVNVVAAVSDDVAVVKVEFFDNGVLRGTEDTAPFAFTWSVSSTENGSHRWTAKAYDAANNTSVSAPVDVVVNVAATSGGTSPTTAAANVETKPVPHAGDAADDAAVWVHPTDVSLSTIIGTDKLGGLAVYDLAGNELYYYADGGHNNVDLRYGVLLNGERVTVVASSDKDADTIRLYKVDPATRGLVHISARSIGVGIGLYGLCMYKSAATGKLYVFDSDSSGTLQQWELFDAGSGKMDAAKVRTVTVGTTTEGCVADDQTGDLYVSEEDVAIWKYGAEPADGAARVMVDDVGANLTPDIEGLAIYYAAGGRGYLVASSQGNNSYAVYEREGANAFVASFTISAGAVDGVSYTDGIDVESFALGSAFPEGVFVAQDNDNTGGNQNFKLVSWGSIARSASPALLVETTYDPRVR